MEFDPIRYEKRLYSSVQRIAFDWGVQGKTNEMAKSNLGSPTESYLIRLDFIVSLFL